MRQTLMFSATMPKEIKKLADRFLSNPKEVSVSPPSATADTVTQQFIKLSARQKRDALRTILEGDDVRNALVFCNRKRDVSDVHRTLESQGFQAGSLHGDMDQFSRTATLDKFKKNEIKFLVCSDVAARGLDIEAMSHVINFDVPTHAEDYVHRIGRTGRAGRQGHAITFVTSEERKYLDAVQDLANGSIGEITLDGIRGVEMDLIEEKPRQGRGRGRGRKDPSSAPQAKEKNAAATGSKEVTPPPTDSKDNRSTETSTERPEQNEPRQSPPEKVVGFGDETPAFLMPATKA